MRNENTRLAWCLTIGMLSLTLMAHSASAQLFGQRSLGQPLRPRSGPAQASTSPAQASTEVGTLRGNERFMRDNRSRNDFVGSSRSSQSGFVGSEQAIGVGRVPAAAESVRPVNDASRRINRPLPPLKSNEPYFPNLVLDASTIPRRADEMVNEVNNRATVDARLTNRLSTENPSVQVLREGQSATLIGEVTDAQQAARIRLLLSFEPGVYSIRDQLIIRQR